jgi:hypothetical protein
MSLTMIVAIIALLAAVHDSPTRRSASRVVLGGLPVLIAEGVVAPIELLSTVGNVLSYARIMALGVASVMLAVVANRMVGAIGSAVVGVVFALLFHLVNFAIALFSPTIHALRLHYVEFFGKFYSPGGCVTSRSDTGRAGHPLRSLTWSIRSCSRRPWRSVYRPSPAWAVARRPAIASMAEADSHRDPDDAIRTIDSRVQRVLILFRGAA